MRRLLGGLAVFMLLATLLPGSVPYPSAQTPAAAAQAVLDDELVLLTSDGRIVVRDPYTPPGIQPVTFQSNDTGWQKVATGDLNGDGDAEIIGLRGGEARVFDPVVLPGSTEVVFNLQVAGQVWELAITGDLVGNSRDEMILTRTTSEGGSIERLEVYGLNASGTGWDQLRSESFGAPWVSLSAGDVDADGKDELVAARRADNRLLIWDPANNWNTLHNATYSFPWLEVEVANTHDATAGDNSGRSEIVALRTGVESSLPSYLIFRCCDGTSLTTVTSDIFFPNFFNAAAGDVNSSGDEEVFLVRDAAGSNGPAVFPKNYGTDAMLFSGTETNASQWRRAETGDTDGDGRDEMVLMSPGEYRIYTDPRGSNTFEPYPGSYISSGEFAVGNLDGPGRSIGPALQLSVTNVELTLEAGQSAARDVAVTNSGAGALNWTAAVTSAGTPWLSVTPTSGVAPGNFQIRINSSGLLANTYNGVVQVAGQSGVANSPQNITVRITVTAPPFRVEPSSIQWFYQIGTISDTRTVQIFGPNLNWHAGVVPMSSVQRIRQAIAAGSPLAVAGSRLLIGAGPEPDSVPIVDWVDVNPPSGMSTTDGSPVVLSLVGNRVPRGSSKVAVVFVTEGVASPRAAVVDLDVLAFRPGDLTFVPMVAAD